MVFFLRGVFEGGGGVQSEFGMIWRGEGGGDGTGEVRDLIRKFKRLFGFWIIHVHFSGAFFALGWVGNLNLRLEISCRIPHLSRRDSLHLSALFPSLDSSCFGDVDFAAPTLVKHSKPTNFVMRKCQALKVCFYFYQDFKTPGTVGFFPVGRMMGGGGGRLEGWFLLERGMGRGSLVSFRMVRVRG